jgi:hypothetical protein
MIIIGNLFENGSQLVGRAIVGNFAYEIFDVDVCGFL